MPTTLSPLSNDRLQPVIHPENARTDAVAFGPNLTIAAGTVVAKDGADNKFYAYSNSGSGGLGIAKGLSEYSFTTDSSGNAYINGAASAPSLVNSPMLTMPIFTHGTFNPDDLTGWDSNALTDLNARLLHQGYINIP